MMEIDAMDIHNTIALFRARIDSLADDVLVETNDGTFGAQECLAAVGTGDGKHGTRKVFERLDGSRYAHGPDEDRMPGRLRLLTQAGTGFIGVPTASRRRAEIAELRDAIKRLGEPGVSVRIPDDIVLLADRVRNSQ